MSSKILEDALTTSPTKTTDTTDASLVDPLSEGPTHLSSGLDDLAMLLAASDDTGPSIPTTDLSDRLREQCMQTDLARLGGKTYDSLLYQLSETRGDIDALQASDDALAEIPTEYLMGIRGYTMSGYAMLNGALRNPQTSAKDLQTYDAYIQNTTAGLDALPPYTGTVYRGTKLPQGVLDTYTKGATITERAFTSSTKSAKVLGEFRDKVTMTITSKTGRDVSGIAHDATEQEVLFKPGTKFKVDDRVDGKTPDSASLTMSEV